MVDIVHILSEQLANILVAALWRHIDRKKQLIVADVDTAGLQNVDELIVDLKNQGVGLRIDGAIDVRPLILRHRRQIPVPREQIVTMRERREYRNKFDMM